MANQLGAVTASKRPRNQIAELNSRQAFLPNLLANKQRKEDIERQDELNKIQQSQFNRQHSLATSRFAFDQKAAEQARQQNNRASEVGMGLSAAKMGTSVATQYGGKSFGDVGNSARNLFSSGGTATGGTGLGGFVDNLSLGSTIGGGLAGFGISKLLGKKSSKITKGLAGAGVGAALGLLSGSNSVGGLLSGGLGGAIGGIFG